MCLANRYKKKHIFISLFSAFLMPYLINKSQSVKSFTFLRSRSSTTLMYPEET